MLGFNRGNGNGGGASPLQKAALWLSLAAGFAISFVSTPKLYGFSVEWAVTSADLGPVLTWIGSLVWFCIVAVLTMLTSNLFLLGSIIFGTHLVGLVIARLRPH